MQLNLTLNFVTLNSINKGIKKLGRILFKILATIIFLLIVLFLLVQMRSVQIFAAKKAATYLSGKMNTRVEIGSVEIEFFKKIVFEDLFIEDLHHDTLLYSKKLKIDIGNINIDHHKIYIYNLVLFNTKASLVKYKNEDNLNLQFIVDAFKTNDTIKKIGRAHV